MNRGTRAIGAVVLGGLLTIASFAHGAPATANANAAAAKPAGAGTVVPVRATGRPDAPRSLGSAALARAQRCDAVRSKLAEYARQGSAAVGCFEPGRALPELRPPSGPRPADVRATDAPVWCDELGDGSWWYTRDSFCLDGLEVSYVLLSPQGAPLGGALLEVSHSAQLNATSSSWVEQVHVSMEARTGQVTSLLVGLTATCGGSCVATKSDAFGVESLRLFEMESGTLEFAGNPLSGGQASTTPTWTLTATAPGAIPIVPSVAWTVPDLLTIRCDALVGNSSGCVLPAYTPTLLLSFATDGASAVMIAWAQQYLPDRWGYEYGGGTPLRRLASESLQRTNRSIICDSSFVPRAEVPEDSCDEFPFAASYESGAMLGLRGSDCAEVLPFIDEVTGQWYVAYLNTVRYTERCVRGHVSLPSNTDVGGDLGRFATQHRVLDHEQYWIGISA